MDNIYNVINMTDNIIRKMNYEELAKSYPEFNLQLIKEDCISSISISRGGFKFVTVVKHEVNGIC